MTTDFDDITREDLEAYNRVLTNLCQLERELLIDGDAEEQRAALIGFFDFCVFLARAGEVALVEVCTDGVDLCLKNKRATDKKRNAKRNAI